MEGERERWREGERREGGGRRERREKRERKEKMFSVFVGRANIHNKLLHMPCIPTNSVISFRVSTVNGNDMNDTNYSLVVGVVCGFCGDGPFATDGVTVPDTVSSTGLAGAAALS